MRLHDEDIITDDDNKGAEPIEDKEDKKEQEDNQEVVEESKQEDEKDSPKLESTKDNVSDK